MIDKIKQVVKRKDGSHSKTLWLNSIIGTLTAITAAMPGVKEFIPPETYAWIMFAMAIINNALYKHTESKRTQP